MKKLLVLILALGMTLSLVACGGEKITLASQTAGGVTIDVPSNYGDFADDSGMALATDEDSQANIAIGVATDAQGFTPADFDEATFAALNFPENPDIAFETFNNAAEVNGVPAVYSKCTLTNEANAEVTIHTYVMFWEDGTLQKVEVTYATGKDTSTETNIDAILKSIQAA